MLITIYTISINIIEIVSKLYRPHICGDVDALGFVCRIFISRAKWKISLLLSDLIIFIAKRIEKLRFQAMTNMRRIKKKNTQFN